MRRCCRGSAPARSPSPSGRRARRRCDDQRAVQRGKCTRRADRRCAGCRCHTRLIHHQPRLGPSLLPDRLLLASVRHVQARSDHDRLRGQEETHDVLCQHVAGACAHASIRQGFVACRVGAMSGGRLVCICRAHLRSRSVLEQRPDQSPHQHQHSPRQPHVQSRR
jgi:hypothetical protein